MVGLAEYCISIANKHTLGLQQKKKLVVNSCGPNKVRDPIKIRALNQ